jgi:hypothetical protein
MFIDRSVDSNARVDRHLYYWFFLWIGAQIFVSLLEALLDTTGTNDNHSFTRVVRGPVSTLYKFLFIRS